MCWERYIIYMWLTSNRDETTELTKLGNWGLDFGFEQIWSCKVCLYFSCLIFWWTGHKTILGWVQLHSDNFFSLVNLPIFEICCVLSDETQRRALIYYYNEKCKQLIRPSENRTHNHPVNSKTLCCWARTV